MELRIEKYYEAFRQKWDKFVLEDSFNGTILQARKFLDYHPAERFEDESLIIFKGNTIIAVVPACKIWENNKKIFSAHAGSSFGGIILNKYFNDIEHVGQVVALVDDFFLNQGYCQVILKNTPSFFSTDTTSLLEYFLFQKGYSHYEELSFVIQYDQYEVDILSNFKGSRRRGCRKAHRSGLQFKQLLTNEEIGNFYDVLCKNLLKFNLKPVHTLHELVEFKESRLKENIAFYGVYFESALVAGSMVFKFKKEVFHTQYLAADPEYLALFPMNFMNEGLITTAREEGFEKFSFGISTEENGKVLNYSLAEFKEGFGTTYSINRTYVKQFDFEMRRK